MTSVDHKDGQLRSGSAVSASVIPKPKLPFTGHQISWVTEWVMEYARPRLMARWKARGRPFIRLDWTFFAVCYGSGVMRRNVYSSAVFTGVDLFTLKFNWTGSSPINHSWHHKTRYTGLLDGKDRIHLRFVILTQYRSVTDRRTDRQTDMP